MSTQSGDHHTAQTQAAQGEATVGVMVGRDVVGGVQVGEMIKLLQALNTAQSATASAVSDLRRDFQGDVQRLQSEFILYRTMDERIRHDRQREFDHTINDVKSGLRGLSYAVMALAAIVAVAVLTLSWLMLRELAAPATGILLGLAVALVRSMRG